jgi:hypothetical protein
MIAQGPARFSDCVLRGVLPTFRRFREQLDDFYDFCRDVIPPSFRLRIASREANGSIRRAR